MNMKISKRDAGLLLGLLGVLAIAIVYNFVYKAYNEKTDALKIENETLQKRVDTLQSLANKYDDLQESTKANQDATRDIIERFPSDLREEDVIMMAVLIQGQAPFETVASVNIGNAMEVMNSMDIDDRLNAAMEDRLGAELAGVEGQSSEDAQTEPETAPTDADGEMSIENIGLSLDGHYILKKRDISITGTATYEGFKEAVKMLAERKDRTQLAVAASYDIESGLVDAQFTLSSYYMTGTGKLYQPPNIPFIIQGTDNIFGTISLEGSHSNSIDRNATQEAEEEGQAESEETESEEADGTD